VCCLTLAPTSVCHAPLRRGQAWALHGFTAAYEATREPLFLSTAQAAADLFLDRLSKDWVPVWDFDAPQGQAWKDSSAGAVAAGGLLRLAEVAAGAARGVRYRTAALRMLHALASGYLADSAPELALASVLRNATLGASGPSGGTMFGDYYFLEALAYQQRQQAGQQQPEQQAAEASAAAAG
jgi:unsaturated chondroitin disaccharide hydrolase